MRHVIFKVGDSHHGPIPAGMILVMPLENCFLSVDQKQLTFKNPAGGLSWGTFIAFTTDEQNEALEKHNAL